MNLPSTENDVARANQMCNSSAMTLRWYTYRSEMYCCFNKLDYTINNAIKANKQYLCLIISINGVHFKDNFKANNFDKVSTNTFPSVPATPAAVPLNQNPNTPVTINDIPKLIAAVSLVTATQLTSPLGGNQMQQTDNSIINPA